MDEEEKAIEHKVITVILPDTEGTIDGGDFLQGTLVPEALPSSQ